MRRTPMTRRRPERARLGHGVLLVAAATLLTACGQAATPGVTPLATGSASSPTELIPGLNKTDAAAFDQWQSAGPTDYRFSVDVQCFCPGAELVAVTVREGEVTGVDPEPPEFWSVAVVPIPDLFRLVGELRGTADIVDVTYDEDLGYPTVISVDRITQAIDDEVRYVVTDFSPLG